MLEMLQHEKKTVGIKQSLKAVNNNNVKRLYIAEDAEKHLVEEIEELAKNNNVEVVRVESMKKLGKACGIDVGAAVAAILK